MENSHNAYEHLYKKQGVAPWTFEEPPKELAALVECGFLNPCKVLEVGCGEGYASIYLASKGFDATGIDVSANVIMLAEENARQQGVKCNFINLDWKQASCLDYKFDFVFDWRFLHEITGIAEREEYMRTVSGLLNDKGKYLSVAFSGEFKPEGKIRKSPVGVPLYLAKNKDIEGLFGGYFNILEKRTFRLPQREVLGGVSSYFFLMQKK